MQHQIQGALLLGLSGIETGRVRGRLTARWWGLGLPLVVAAVGLMFALHAQHGGGDMQLQLVQHRITGVTLILSGAFMAVDALRRPPTRWPAIAALALLLAVVVQLLFYAERAAQGLPMAH